MLDASRNAQINQLWNNELVSKIRPEAWWSYHSQDYKSPNGLSLYRYPKNCGKLVKDNTD
jgi:hypothetical protein